VRPNALSTANLSLVDNAGSIRKTSLRKRRRHRRRNKIGSSVSRLCSNSRCISTKNSRCTKVKVVLESAVFRRAGHSSFPFPILGAGRGAHLRPTALMFSSTDFSLWGSPARTEGTPGVRPCLTTRGSGREARHTAGRTPAESTLTENAALTPLKSALTKTHDCKSPEISTYRKAWGWGLNYCYVAMANGLYNPPHSLSGSIPR
jgi:hypothetical protein